MESEEKEIEGGTRKAGGKKWQKDREYDIESTHKKKRTDSKHKGKSYENNVTNCATIENRRN